MIKWFTSKKMLLCLLFWEIVFFAFILRGNGDTGAYVSFANQYHLGALPYVDFWYQQGLGYPFIISFFLYFVPKTMFGHRLIFLFFTLITAWICYRFLKHEVEKRGSVFSDKQFIFVLLLALLSFDFWNFMAREGTKSSLVVLLLLSSLFSLSYYFETARLRYLVISSVASALLVATKFNFLAVPFVQVLGVFLYSRSRLKSVLVYSALFSLVCLVVYWPILQGDRIQVFIDNFLITKGNYAYFSSITTKMDKFLVTPRFVNYLYLKYLPLVPLLFYCLWYVKSFRSLLIRENAGLILIVATALIYAASNFVLLFPSISSMHQDVVFPGLVCVILIAFFVTTSSRMDLAALYKSKVFGMALGFVGLSAFCLLLDIGPVGGGRFLPFKPSDVIYELFGKNGVADTLDRVYKKDPRLQYVFIGRQNHHAAATKLREAPISASGSHPTEFIKPSRETANRYGMIAESNFVDLMERYKVLVIEKARLEEISQYGNFTTEAHRRGFTTAFSDRYYEVLVEGNISN